jgi:hypothetical protein
MFATIIVLAALSAAASIAAIVLLRRDGYRRMPTLRH